MHELLDLALLCGVSLFPAIGLAVWFAKFRPDWSTPRAAMLSALPVPIVIWVICLAIVVNSSLATEDECGIDACGMATGAAVVLATYGLIAFGIGTLVAFLVRKLMKNQPSKPKF